MEYIVGPEHLIRGALRRAAGAGALPAIGSVERPENPAHGDYATNIALQLASERRQMPIVVADDLAAQLRHNPHMKDVTERIEVAPPGFINFFLSPAWLAEQVPAIVALPTAYGRLRPPATRSGRRIKAQVEFISANPTGPLTLANGRGGFLGDALANVLAAAGYDVTREYYVNDAGEQVRKLGASVLASLGYPVPYAPEELYQGNYIHELAVQLDIPRYKKHDTANDHASDSKLLESTAREAAKVMLRDIKRVCRKIGIRFDVWFSERSLYRQRFVEETLAALKRKRLVEERDGALWLMLRDVQDMRRPPERGGSQREAAKGGEGGRVLVKSSGEPTYVLPDLAYHVEKFRRRKFAKVIDIFGADHHAHAKVLIAGLRALGLPAPDIILMQLVRLVEDGREVKMSKRTGTFVTLEELVDEVGLDVARWFFLERAPETHMDFQLSLAREHSEKNPVFYVQYAHARCASILRKASVAEPRGTSRGRPQRRTTLNSVSLSHPSETALAKELVRLPDLIARIAETYEVHQLTTYATEVATAFSAFYRDCHVLTEDSALRVSRLALVRATQIVLANTLGLLGIRAPSTM